MFENEDIAFAVREHMINAVWMISSSAVTSPVTESSEDEQRIYRQAIDKICETIKTEVLNPIFDRYPALVQNQNYHYQRFVRKNV